MKNYNTKELMEIIEEHEKWLCNEGGRRADLRRADLRRADLSDADLRSADLSGADLSDADLRSADLSDADLRSADLSGADLRSANLRRADLSDADLRSADLSGADLSGADLSGANLRRADLDFSCMPLWCGDLSAKYDEKQIIQQLYHVLSHVKHSEEIDEKVKNALLSSDLIDLANKFHRVDECGKLV